MTDFLDRTTPLNEGLTNREIFAAERDRITAILNDPEKMKDRRNEALEWSLLAMNEILNGETAEFMMEKYLTEILTAKVLARAHETAAAKQKMQMN